MKEPNIEKIWEQANKILKKEYSEDAYYEYSIWENYGKKRAYFQGYESGHGKINQFTKELRRTAFYVDMKERKIVGQGLYASLGKIKNIKI